MCGRRAESLGLPVNAQGDLPVKLGVTETLEDPVRVAVTPDGEQWILVQAASLFPCHLPVKLLIKVKIRDPEMQQHLIHEGKDQRRAQP